MNKRNFVALLLTFLFFSFVNVYANEINVTVDGENIVFTDQAPAIIDGRTLVPIRAVFEHIGFSTGWEESTETVTLTRGEDIVSISIGSNTFIANGQTEVLDVPAQIIGGRTLLPIRSVLESVGYSIFWNDATSTVEIISEVPELITIPNRRLTDEEINTWTMIYNASGANDFELEIIRLTNIERAAEGLSPVELYTPLMMAARFKAQSMSDLDYWSHENPVYGEFFNIPREIFGITQRSLGENLARGNRTPEEIVQSWMDSQGHRENILNPIYTRVGVGFHNNHWTQKFSN